MATTAGTGTGRTAGTGTGAEPGTTGDEPGTWDVVVVGAGPVGENVADHAVRGGLTAVVVEDRLVGGECSYWACMPSKALLRPGEALRAARAVDGARQGVTGGVDPAAALARRTAFTSGWDDASQVEWLDSAGIGLVRGRGRLTGEREVTVRLPGGGERVLRARRAVALCTGSVPVVPDVPGLADAAPWTNREALESEDVPGRLVVVGGGPVGCELAGAFADLGAAVTLLVRGELLAGHEPFAGELVGAALRERGVDVRTGVSVTAVEAAAAPDDAGAARAQAGAAAGRGGGTATGHVVRCDDGRSLPVDRILLATGRRPATDGLDLGAVGLTGLGTDDSLRVLGADGEPVPWLYAAGDVNGRSPVTHQGKYQARVAAAAIVARSDGGATDDRRWGGHAATADEISPQVVFTDPQVASVGRTAAAAREAGLPVTVVDQDLGEVAGAALHADGLTGRVRLVVDTDRQVVVGATFVGPDVAEMLHAATIAVVGEVPLARLRHAVPVFPTMSEVWLRLLEQL